MTLRATDISDYYGVVFDYWNNMKPFKVALEFGYDLNTIYFHQIDQSFYYCDRESSFCSSHDCYAQLLSKANFTNCQKNCFSTRAVQGYLPLMKDVSMLENCTSTEELCLEKDPEALEMLVNETKCQKSCKLTYFTGELEEQEYEFDEPGVESITIKISYPSSSTTSLEEYPIYNFLGLVSSIGGSLGICVGISVYDILSLIVDKIFGISNYVK